MGAARVTEVLARTGGFSTKVARHRMYETTQHILQVTQSLESIKPGGAGHASSVRVRLLHAAVRRRIMKLAAERPSYYSVPDLGIPINDLDCKATINTFSSALIWVGLPRQGIFLRQQEILDYLALWRLVAYYLGTPTADFETPQQARYLMESLLASEIRPTETSKILANNIILSLQGQPPAYASRNFLTASARWLNGNELGDALGLDHPSLYYWALVAGQCVFFMCLCYTYRSIPYLDRRKIKVRPACVF
jgi:ribosomal protein S28E/S33